MAQDARAQALIEGRARGAAGLQGVRANPQEVRADQRLGAFLCLLMCVVQELGLLSVERARRPADAWQVGRGLRAVGGGARLAGLD
jgi:hypothetical protein